MKLNIDIQMNDEMDLMHDLDYVFVLKVNETTILLYNLLTLSNLVQNSTNNFQLI